LKSDVKALQKQVAKDMKAAQKSSGKRKSKTDENKKPKAPSGFVKPTLITDELAKFLGKPSGTEMARTEVTREINSYIRANKLQDSNNGRKILADDALSTLLRLSPKDELTYFNLQKYMSCHFAKGGVLPATTTA
jgi:chromatin remodeling complex protein RSC6